jgi:hypothetical protein
VWPVLVIDWIRNLYSATEYEPEEEEQEQAEEDRDTPDNESLNFGIGLCKRGCAQSEIQSRAHLRLVALYICGVAGDCVAAYPAPQSRYWRSFRAALPKSESMTSLYASAILTRSACMSRKPINLHCT